MTRPASTSAVPTGEASGGDGVGARRARVVVAALAVTQTVGYGTLYYSFAVLLTPLAHDLYTSTTAVTGAFTAAVLVGAAAAIPVGRWLDRHGGRALMTAGSVAGAGLLALLSTVDSLVGLYAVWIGVGLASAVSLYEAAFAVIVARYPDPRRRANALLAVTVVAGFASSIFLPLTGALVDQYGWRTAVLILAAIHAVVTVPLHAAVLRRPPHQTGTDRIGHATTTDTGDTNARRRAIHTAVHDRHFWILTIAFVANAAALAALSVHLVAYLVELGHPAVFAATISGLLGVLSVTGRLAITGLQRHLRTTTAVAGVFTIQALAASTLPLIGHSTVGAVGGVTAFGLGFGVATIARPALLATRYDTTGFATIAGITTVPMTIAKAGAPLAAAALHAAADSYTPILLATAVACLIAAAGIAVTPTSAVDMRQPTHPRGVRTNDQPESAYPRSYREDRYEKLRRRGRRSTTRTAQGAESSPT
jgi:predicted MFS family arabinose efflux permease